MTLRNKFLNMLIENGLFEDQAKAIVEKYINSDLGKEMRGRMDEDESGYPPQLFAVVWMGLKTTAVKWIDENIPKHWARPMFAD